MLLPLIFLIVSVLAVLVMVLFRVWELRVGRLSVRDEDIPETFFSIDKAEARFEDFLSIARIFSIHALALLISQLIIFSRHLREVSKSEWKKLSAYLPKHLPHLPHVPHNTGGSSFFLKDISAHKDEVRKENGYHTD